MDRGRLKQPGEYLINIGGACQDRGAALIKTGEELTDVLYRRIVDKHDPTGRKPCS